MIGCYCRVSTTDQNLDRQLSSTTDYASDNLEGEPAEIDVYRDKSSGTNTQRDGYRDLIDDVEADVIDTVIVHEISRLARSLQDLERTVSRIADHGAEVHFVRDGLTFGTDDDDPMSRLQMQMLGAFAEWEARVKRLNTKEGIAARQANEDYHHGRAPLGFSKDDGRLIPAEKYDQVIAILDMVLKDELSKRKAAQELDTSRKTIDRSLERADLYGL